MVADIYLLAKYARKGYQRRRGSPGSRPVRLGEREEEAHDGSQHRLVHPDLQSCSSAFSCWRALTMAWASCCPSWARMITDRRVIINTIGPFWDGNEVWLITAGGAMFAAFPNWYATMFSGFYLALLLMLLALIVRGVAFEFRSKDKHPAWRKPVGLDDLCRQPCAGAAVGCGLCQPGPGRAHRCRHAVRGRLLEPAQSLRPVGRAGDACRPLRCTAPSF